MSLGGLQERMLDALIAPSDADRDFVHQHLIDSPSLQAAQRLAIYQRSYIARLLECMVEQFPALHHALADELFRDFGREYLRAHPSQSRTLYDLGERFPAYLQATRPDRDLVESEREGWIDFMVDLAHYEHQLFRMFDAPGHEGKPFASEDTPDERLVLQPCFAVRAYRYPVAWYYHEVRLEHEPAFPAPLPSFVALSRTDYMTRTFPLTRAHYLFLRELKQGHSVPEALAHLARVHGQSSADVSHGWATKVRQDWIAAGFFIPACA